MRGKANDILMESVLFILQFAGLGSKEFAAVTEKKA